MCNRSEAYNLAKRLLSVVYRGTHHIPGMIKDMGGHAVCNILDGISTYDSNTLTRLVITAHEMKCRVEIRSSGPHRLKLILSQRRPIEESGEYPIMLGHETIDNAIKVFRENNRDQFLRRDEPK